MSDWLSKQLARPSGDALVASVRELLALKVHPDHIAHRMGRPSAQALSRALARMGEAELSNTIIRDPMASQARVAAPLTRAQVRRANRTLGK